MAEEQEKSTEHVEHHGGDVGHAAEKHMGIDGSKEGGLKGHLKKNAPIYLIIIGGVTLLVILLFNSGGGSNAQATPQDAFGYGTGNNPNDLGAQTASDYNQLQNQNDLTNALLQEMLLKNMTTGKSKVPNKDHHKHTHHQGSHGHVTHIGHHGNRGGRHDKVRHSR